jgi:hypothetical protein
MSDNPLSTYDLIYKAMSEEDRARLSGELATALKAGTESVKATLVEAVEKATSAMYQSLVVNPYPELVKENASAYEFVQALANGIWNNLLESDPAKLNQRMPYSMRDLVDAWRKQFPDQWAAVVGEKAATEIRKLEEQIEFQRSVNEARRF